MFCFGGMMIFIWMCLEVGLDLLTQVTSLVIWKTDQINWTRDSAMSSEVTQACDCVGFYRGCWPVKSKSFHRGPAGTSWYESINWLTAPTSSCPKYIVWTAYYSLGRLRKSILISWFQMWRSPLNPADSWKDLQGKYNETDFLTHVGHTAHINLCAASCRFIEVVREASACWPLSMALLFLSYVRYAGITPSLSLGTIAVAFKSSIWHFSAWLLGLLRNVSGLSASLWKVIFPETIS